MITADASLQRLFKVLETSGATGEPYNHLQYCLHLHDAIRKRAGRLESDWADIILPDGSMFTRDHYDDILTGGFEKAWTQVVEKIDDGDKFVKIQYGFSACQQMLNIADEYLAHHYDMYMPAIRAQMLGVYGVYLEHIETKSQSAEPVMPQEVVSLQEFGEELENLFGKEFAGYNAETHSLNTLRIWANVYAYQIGYQIMAANETRWPHEQDVNLNEARSLAAEAWNEPALRTHPCLKDMFNFLSDVIEAQETMLPTQIYRLACRIERKLRP